jgi:tRNA wybutosine-synthesizing protein 3
MDTFQKQKQDFLSKKDKSKKGSIDEKMRPIVNLINSLDNYYTTSSCAGRIVLLHQLSGEKQGAKWLFSSHSSIKGAQLKKALSQLPKKGIVWLLAEAPIIHVACWTQEDAWTLVGVFRNSGFKRAHIISSTKNRTTIEAFGNQRVEMPIARQGNLMLPNNFCQFLAEVANDKLKKSRALLNKLVQNLKKFKAAEFYTSPD